MNISFVYLTRTPLKDTSLGAKLLKLLRGTVLEPVKFGDYEPIRNPFSYDSLESALECWDGFMWKTKHKATALVSTTKWFPQDKITVFDMDIDPEDLAVLVQKLHSLLPCDFASYSAYSSNDVRRPYYRETVYALSLLNARHLASGVPTVPWFMVCGAPYIELWGRKRLLTAPVYKAWELADDLIVLQLTEELDDVEKNPEGFWEAREKVISHLGRETFQISNPGKKIKRVPEFEWIKPRPER